SEMDEPYRENVAVSLNKLLEDLKIVKTVEERDVVLDSAISNILKETDNSSSTVEIINEIWKMDTETSKLLAKMLNYYDWSKIDEWNKYSAKVNELRESFVYQVPQDTELDKTKRQEETKLLLANTSEKVITALSLSKIEETDVLFTVIVKFATANEYNEEFGTRLYGFQTLSEIIDTIGYDDVQRELDETFTSMSNEIYSVLSQQKTNTDTGEYAITKICTLFGYNIPKFERPNFIESSSGNTSDGDSQGGPSGAIGEGTQYGSDDLVYDPITNKYVKYGEIIERYHALMLKKVEGGNLSDDEKSALEKYFDILYTGFDEEETENSENE
ncbi:MAG: hypothetical protein IKA02_06440, partial [Clostridia bacterium]|nr:hypothetical protein [Clostridia bacterium]